AFMAPFDGTYSISDLAVRRVHNQGGIVTYKVFDTSKNQVATLTASNNRAWVTDEKIYELGFLSVGDRIYFAVDKGENDNFYWDATEIVWTVTFGEDGGTTGPGNNLPYDFALKQNYPNPFNAHTVIKYQLPSTSNISLKVYDVFGQEVYRLAEGLLPAGFKTVVWDGRDGLGKTVGSGIYFVRLETKGFMYTRKMILLR
ncbi:MAG: T9SS type A sorting domain-containing protein, partial [Candidatus Marinimicrobia bacterium]|nr:T9SS type A sorting domain-containing protein [Candidatus Neomarinimicrobiota bacterium]